MDLAHRRSNGTAGQLLLEAMPGAACLSPDHPTVQVSLDLLVGMEKSLHRM